MSLATPTSAGMSRGRNTGKICGSAIVFWRDYMAKKLYVGNLGSEVGVYALEAMFKPYGTVFSAEIIVDRDTGQSRGFGFVQMETARQANAAMAAINGKDHNGRALKVSEAWSRRNRSESGSFSDGGGTSRDEF
jgi:cold-inducible RNA-binding protein